MPMVSLYLSPSHTLPTSLPPFSTRASSQPSTHKPRNKLSFLLLSPRRASSVLASSTGGDGNGASLAVEEKKAKGTEGETPAAAELKVGEEKKKSGSASNGAALVIEGVPKFSDKRWVNGTWDLQQFNKAGSTDWDAVIEAEARRRKWLQDNPEASSNGDPVLFDTSIVPWWAWIKKYHLPEAELLNGRAAMIGFFMAYFVDGLTGVGIVGQMGNFLCKSLLLVAVAGVLLIRKNEDFDNLKKLIDETTFYDKQWQATWQDEAADDGRKE